MFIRQIRVISVSIHSPEQFLNFRKAMIKYLFKLSSYKQCIRYIAEEPEGQFIMYDIGHLYPAFNIFKMMLVMP